jgi:hypothetical protein
LLVGEGEVHRGVKVSIDASTRSTDNPVCGHIGRRVSSQKRDDTPV